MKKLPPYARQFGVPADNMTVFVMAGWPSWQQVNDICHSRGVIMPQGECPYDYEWPVSGAGVIVMDYVNMDEKAAMTLACALMDSGAEEVQWMNYVDDNKTGWLIRGKKQDSRVQGDDAGSTGKGANEVHENGRSCESTEAC